MQIMIEYRATYGAHTAGESIATKRGGDTKSKMGITLG